MNYDETQEKILNATMELIMEKGYSSTTTKDIAKLAQVNECTIFRKFKGKKEIVLTAMTRDEWNPKLKEEDFDYEGDLEKDLSTFAKIYISKVTTKMVKVSLGLRTPELFDVTKDGIMKVPQTFKNVLEKYFLYMKSQGKINIDDIESLAIEFLSINFGFVFFKASFGDRLTDISSEQYILSTVRNFVKGIG